jgi:hypothetical protein
MKTLTLVGVRRQGENHWRYGMDYDKACEKYRRVSNDLELLCLRLETVPAHEFKRIEKSIESKRSSVRMLEKWFRFTGNKIPETS